jgi:hypothetical protein
MRRVLVLIAGLLAGIVLTGAVAPGIIWMLPPGLRGESVLWTTAIVVIAATMGAVWILSASGPGGPSSPPR